MSNRAARLVAAVRADGADASDRELLERYTASGDQAAFAAVVRRHAGMVLDVCYRTLRSRADAEDACQAVFLVLANKAASTRWQASAANWLYATARQVARNARRAAVRRGAHERQAAVPETAGTHPPGDPELLTAFDAELERLSPVYREALVLCCLEGLARDEAAEQLGVPLATLKRRLERGRAQLGRALTAGGWTLGVALFLTAATTRASARRLVDSVLAAVGGSPSAAAAALVKETAMRSVLSGVQRATLGATAAVALGLGLFALSAAEPPKAVAPKADPPAKGAEKGDPPKERTVSGRVLDSAGKPVAAELSLVWADAKPQPLGKANADGTFKVTVPMLQNNSGGSLVATAAGHGPDFVPHGIRSVAHSTTPTAEVALRLPKERPVKGRVLDQQGKPVAGATVAAWTIAMYASDAAADTALKRWSHETGTVSPPIADRTLQFPFRGRRDPASPPSLTAATDKDGRFELAGVGEGQLVELEIRGPGVADQKLLTFVREKFDPDALNRAVTRVAPDAGITGVTSNAYRLYGPDPVVTMDQEKVIRGTVTGPDGMPRAGVRVAFTRLSRLALNPTVNAAVTGKDGKYEIRGARKHPTYGVECPADTAAGLLPCQAFADDTVGYEPVTIDLKTAKGVVVTGTVTNKKTGAPVPAHVIPRVLKENPHADKYPSFENSAGIASREFATDGEGRFRVVTIPGPVLLMVSASGVRPEEFRPLQLDPKRPEFFDTTYPSSLSTPVLMYWGYGGHRGIVHGSWCKVLDLAADDPPVSLTVELEPSTRTSVRAIDADGKPVTDVSAAGTSHIDVRAPVASPGSDVITLFNVEPKAGRLVAVVHEQRQLVGSATVFAEDKDPVVKLGAGGTVTGRAVGEDGKPLAGMQVHLDYSYRTVSEAYRLLTRYRFPETDANGEFRFEHLFPGEEFTLRFTKGPTRFPEDPRAAPAFKVGKHGDTLKLGDLRLSKAGVEKK